MGYLTRKDGEYDLVACSLEWNKLRLKLRN